MAQLEPERSRIYKIFEVLPSVVQLHQQVPRTVDHKVDQRTTVEREQVWG